MADWGRGSIIESSLFQRDDPFKHKIPENVEDMLFIKNRRM